MMTALSSPALLTAPAAFRAESCDKLRPMARAVAPGPEVHGCSLNVSFLVDRSDIDDFRATALRFADIHRERVELRLAGPLPCYSFVTLRDLPAPAVGV